MTSLINPNNIDGAYPVAGQDNNSQGFRDNFTNTKTNFQYAAEEITDLQNKAVLKSALTGTTLNNDMNGSIISNVQLQDFGQTRVTLGTLSGNITINFAAGGFQTLQTSGNISLNFINFPPAGSYGTLILQIVIANRSHTVTFPSSVSVNAVGITGFDSLTNTMTFPATGSYRFVFASGTGGSTIDINENNELIRPFNNSGEFVTAGNPCTLGVTTSKFEPNGASITSSLGDGIPGEIKQLLYIRSATGTVTVTVASAGWNGGASGTVTLSSRGQGCILRWADDAWWCTGNNGCTFG